MLFVFRNYQKSLYAFIVVLLFFSFLLTSYVRVSNPKTTLEEKKKIIGKLYDGGDLEAQHLKGVQALIDAEGALVDQHPVMEGFFCENIIDTAVLDRVYNSFKDQLQIPLDECKNKVSKLKVFKDPNLPELSLENIYARLAPGCLESINKIRSSSLDADAYFEEAKHYLDLQSKVSYALVHQFYEYMAMTKGFKGVAPKNLSLIPVSRKSDLFSKKFMEVLSLTLINCAEFAKNSGVEVSDEHIRAEIVGKVAKALQEQEGSLLPKNQISIKSIASYFSLSEASFLKAYKTLVLFKKYIQISKNTNLMDSFALEKIQNIANQKIQMDVIDIPEGIKIANFDDLLKFQVYLESLTTLAQDRRRLDFDVDVLDIQDIQKIAPELVCEDCSLHVKRVNIKELASCIPLKAMLKWQLVDKNFLKICETFKEIPCLGVADEATKKHILQKLEPKFRQKVDQKCREWMFLEDKSKLEQHFSGLQGETISVSLNKSGRSNVFQGAKDAAVVLEKLSSVEDKEIFSFDDENFYQVTVLERSQAPRILDFKTALEEGQLDVLLNRYMKERYPQVRIFYRELFETAEKDWLSFEVAKKHLPKILFKELFQSIEEQAGFDGIALNAQNNFYVKHRFDVYLRNILESLNEQSTLNRLVVLDKTLNQEHPFFAQFIPKVQDESMLYCSIKMQNQQQIDPAKFNCFQGPVDISNKGPMILSIRNIEPGKFDGSHLSELQEVIGKEDAKKALDTVFSEVFSDKMIFLIEE
jgi:hypothetical protein